MQVKTNTFGTPLTFTISSFYADEMTIIISKYLQNELKTNKSIYISTT